MKILLTCGGTAGHINPAVALARMFQERMEDSQVPLCGGQGRHGGAAGAQGGLPHRDGDHQLLLAQSEPVLPPGTTCGPCGIYRCPKRRPPGFWTAFSRTWWWGRGDMPPIPWCMRPPAGASPHSGPRVQRRPRSDHQRLAKVADRVMVGYEDSRQHYHHPDRVVVTGTPVRGDFFRLTRQQARDALGIRDDRPLVLSYWGSLGAEVMNGYMTDFIRRAVREGAPLPPHPRGGGGTMGPCRRPWRGSPCRRRSSCGSTSMTCPR